MKLVLFVTVGVTLVLLTACMAERRPPKPVRAEWKPWREPVLTADQLNSALEARWTPEMIRAFCNSTPPTSGSLQNLVALGPAWNGVLYKDLKTGFDSIWWYASTKNNKLDEYSLNATKGHKNWI